LLLALVVASLTLILSVVTALTYPYFDFYMVVSVLLASLFIFIAVRIIRPAISKTTPAVMIKALVVFWFLAPLLVAVPFSLFAGLPLPDAYFEMVSGFTGTGFTVLNPSNETPFINAIRAASQWGGEVGALFLTLILAIVFHMSPTGIVSALGKGERVRPSMYKTVIDLVTIYVVLTVIPITYMYLTGMKLYDAIVYTFAALATGGFAPTAGGTADLDFWQQFAVIFTCFLGALNFSIYLNLRYGKVRQALGHPELKMMVASIFFYAVLLLLVWRAFDWWHLWSAIFHSASAVTTSGFQIEDVSSFSESAKYVITIAMIVGASAFSTGGGIKLFRAYVLGRLILRELRGMGAPRGLVNPITVMGKEISSDDIITMLTVVTTYIFSLLLIALLITELLSMHKVKVSSIDVIFEVASAMSGTGLSSGLTSVAPADVRLVLASAMIVGKLEVLPFLYALATAFKSLKK